MNSMTSRIEARGAFALSVAGRRPNSGPRCSEANLCRLGVPLLRTHVALTFWRRLRGLHALPPLAPDEALCLAPCRAVHTHRLGYAIDVVFLDEDGIVLRVTTLEPRQGAWCRRAHAVVETAAGTAARIGLRVGQHLEITDGGER